MSKCNYCDATQDLHTLKSKPKMILICNPCNRDRYSRINPTFKTSNKKTRKELNWQEKADESVKRLTQRTHK